MARKTVWCNARCGGATNARATVFQRFLFVLLLFLSIEIEMMLVNLTTKWLHVTRKLVTCHILLFFMHFLLIALAIALDVNFTTLKHRSPRIENWLPTQLYIQNKKHTRKSNLLVMYRMGLPFFGVFLFKRRPANWRVSHFKTNYWNTVECTALVMLSYQNRTKTLSGV